MPLLPQFRGPLMALLQSVQLGGFPRLFGQRKLNFKLKSPKLHGVSKHAIVFLFRQPVPGSGSASLLLAGRASHIPPPGRYQLKSVTQLSEPFGYSCFHFVVVIREVHCDDSWGHPLLNDGWLINDDSLLRDGSLLTDVSLV